MSNDKKVSLAELKQCGFIPQKQKDHFSLRIKTVGGMLDADSLEAVSRLAKKYGKDYVHMTSRQSIEIPYVQLEDVEAIRKEMEASGLKPGVLGSALRTVTACQGNTICGSGQIETSELAKIIENECNNIQLSHKFKIGVTGCPNNCLKAEENDIGLKGTFVPKWKKKDCTYCGVCDRHCPVNAIQVERKEKKLKFSSATCIGCGRCARVCPHTCWDGEKGVQVYYGGVFGRKIRLALPLLEVLYEKKDILAAIRAGMEFFAEHGEKKERFVFTLDRIGLDVFCKFLQERGLPLRKKYSKKLA